MKNVGKGVKSIRKSIRKSTVMGIGKSGWKMGLDESWKVILSHFGAFFWIFSKIFIILRDCILCQVCELAFCASFLVWFRPVDLAAGFGRWFWPIVLAGVV